MTERVSRTTWFWLAAGIILTAYKFWLTRGQTIFAIGQAGHDDRLFLLLAQSIANGEWLGAYNQLTLAKGPFYSLWIAGTYWLGVPLLLANQIAYAGACALFVRACRPAIASAAALFALYALLLWNPVTFEASSLGRVLRQHVNVPQVMLIFGAFTALYYRRTDSLRRQVPWAVILGLGLAAFWLTREEGIFLLPALALLGAACIGAAWASYEMWRRMLASFGIAAICFAVPLLVISGLNARYYGWFGTVEFRAAEFKDAYGAMLRVRMGPEIPYVPVTRQAREAMYAVSPTFARLRPYLDGNIGRDWAEGSAALTGTTPDDRQIAGGWLMWALRDSVVAAGEAPDARRALQFYWKMAEEINAACDDGRLPSGPRRSGFVPRLRDGQVEQIARTFFEFARFVTGFATFSVRPGASEGSDEDFELFRDLTRERIAPREGEMSIMGPATALLDNRKLDRLESISNALGKFLPRLFLLAQLLALGRALQLLWNRQWTFPMTLATAAWAAGAAALLINASIHVTSFPVLVISSFAAVYPLLTLFIGVVAWEVATAWRRPLRRARIAEDLTATTVAEPTRTPPPAFAGRLVVAGGVLALSPFLIWQRQFSELFWFGDEYQLLHEIAQMGLREWTLHVFSENFVPIFKMLWGGALHVFDGSYLAMLWLLWLTHAVNTLLLGKILFRAGLSWFGVLVGQLVFGLVPANIETLGWTVQWSAVLATTFLLLGLLWLDKVVYRPGGWNWRVHGPLVLFAAASACSFSRGVLTGGVLACGLLLPAAAALSGRALRARMAPAMACLLPAIIIAIIITVSSSGNHRQMSGHWGDAFEFAAHFFFLNPFHALFGAPAPTSGSMFLLGTIKTLTIVGGLVLARGRVRLLLALLLIYDLGNAVLIGVGRYHTGNLAALSSRYNYSSLLATLPFVALLLSRVLEVRAWPKARPVAFAAMLIGIVWFALRGWPADLAEFTGWRGTDMRALLQQPNVSDPKASIPGVEFLHVERAKALQRAYNLH